MNEPFSITLEDDDGNVVLPKNPGKEGNAFSIRHLPRKGDEIQIYETRYTVIDVIHRLTHEHPAFVSLRVALIDLDLNN
ncbi:hypothetical protein [Prosthecobacter sp.]|uniref:hypothetical protein n=1 Tax=Prosthecobacter sp. TaxID=1965333 RepID=UPI002ABBEEB0|nr:hypothetical protein [Prosthecobacter sp.]MDZ4404450.1 hypothetical protein [Prosthecobacter sp.]